MSRWARWLATQEQAALRRRLPGPRPPGTLSSNDYLGLSTHPAIRSALAQALALGLPHGATGSRLLSGDHPALTAAEQAFARWQGSEAALWFPSGYAANVGLLSALVEPGDRVISDALNHASLIDGIRLGRGERHIVPHADVAAVADALEPARPSFVVVESLYSMDGDLADLRALAGVCAAAGAWLVVDEAHATGLFGGQGQGRVVAEGLRGQVLASVHTLGKALGLAGAMVCTTAEVREVLINRARSFVFSTAPPPMLGPAVEAAIEVVRHDDALRARPLRWGARLRSALTEHDTCGSQSHIVPVVVGSAARALALSVALATRGWDAMPIRPPTVPPGRCRVRLVLHAHLDAADVDRLATDLSQCLEGLDVA